MSRANDSSGQGSGISHSVAPMPRLSNVVQRKSCSKNGIWYGCQSVARPPPPDTQTMSGPVAVLDVVQPRLGSLDDHDPALTVTVTR